MDKPSARNDKVTQLLRSKQAQFQRGNVAAVTAFQLDHPPAVTQRQGVVETEEVAEKIVTEGIAAVVFPVPYQATLAECEDLVIKNPDNICALFQFPGLDKNDFSRLSFDVPANEEPPALQDIRSRLELFIVQTWPEAHGKLSKVQIIMNNACGGQGFHADRRTGAGVQFLVPLMPATLRVLCQGDTMESLLSDGTPPRYERRTITEGEMLCWAGDFAHAGDSMKSYNMRLHYYWDGGEPIEENTTYY